MSSGGWEVVGKNKKDKTGGKAEKLTKSEKKKFIDNAPKFEDFLPLSQVKTYYDNLQSNNKENKKPAKEKENKVKEHEEKKKQQKHQQNEKKKEKEEPKQKLPKTIEEALNAIDPKEFQDILTTRQVRFPNVPLFWLKDLVTYLNESIPIENCDPIFSNKPQGYPLNIMPKALRTTFEKAITLNGPQNAQMFYEFLLIAIMTNMNKNCPVIGYKMAIQIMAKYYPKMVLDNISRLISLRTSYQNRKPIGMSLMWIMAQSSKEDLNTAVKVWYEVMAPMLEAKNYSHYASQLMLDYLAQHENCSNLSPDLYLNVLDAVMSGKFNIPAAQTNRCEQIVEKIREIVFRNNSANYRKLFEALISRRTSKISCPYRDEIIKSLLCCLVTDDNCFNTWKSLHQKNPHGSHTLLKCIEGNWTNLKQTLNAKHLSETLTSFVESHDVTKKSKGKDDSLLAACVKESKTILSKMKQDEEPRERSFPWRACFFFLIFVLGAVLLVDYQKHGSTQRMRTNILLKNNKAVEYAQNAWSTVTLYTNQGLQSIEKSYPEQYKFVAENTKAYSKLVANGVVIAKNSASKVYSNIVNYAAAKQPVIAASLEDFAPGLLVSIHEHSSKGLKLVTTYYAKLGEQVIEHSTMMIRWMEMNVFIGKFSPESLQNYASQALNTTQKFASETFHWVYEKVQTLSNVH